mgnify:CR=1 FL=1
MNYTKQNFRNFLAVMLLSLSLACSKTDDLTSMVEIMPEGMVHSPNILLIIADDMGVDATPGYGIGTVQPHMPNLICLLYTSPSPRD